MSDAWDAEDRAIARALDAASEAETRGADEQLVDEYRDLLAQMPAPEVPPTSGTEDRIVAAALERRPATAPTLETTRNRRSRRLRLVTLGAATVAAAIVVGLIVHNGTGRAPEPTGHVTLATVHRADIVTLLRAPGTRTGNFGSTPGHVAIALDGTGAVYGLAETDPLEIGLVSAGGTTVVGPARPRGGSIAFVVDHPERVTAVSLVRNGHEIARAALTPS